jgi:hypothetical protein
VKVYILGLLGAFVAFGAKPAEEAKRLYEQGLQAERSGQFAKASVLYSRAAALDPSNPMYRLRGEAAARMAAPKPLVPNPILGVVPMRSPAASEARRLLPPPQLEPQTGPESFDIRGDARALFEHVAQAYGLTCVFDTEYESRPALRFQIRAASFEEAVDALEAATGSFIVPLAPKRFLVANDTPPNRSRLEPFVSVTVPIPQATSPQELTEIARAVQQTMGLERVGLDSQNGLFVIRGPVSKVLPAQKLFEDLLRYHSQVSIELDILEVDRQTLRAYGLSWPSTFSVTSASTVRLADLARLGLNAWVFSIGVDQAQLLAQLSDTVSRSLMHLELRSEDGKPATFHVGERYPVLTTGYFGAPVTGSGSSSPNVGNTNQGPSTFGNLPNPSSVAVGDFNEDHIPDLAVASAGANEVGVFSGNGDGTFADPVFFAVGASPSAVAAADLNNDGHLDLVTANAASGSLTILLGNGDGTFQNPLPEPVGSNPLSLTVADFNRDGNPDLAVTCANSDAVWILLGRGDGRFDAADPLPVGSHPRALASADFNGDGVADLAVVHSGSNDLWILLGQGNGAFRKAQVYATGSSPSAIAADYLGTDRNLDLVVANAASNDVSVFLGDGTGQFTEKGRFQTGASPVSLFVRDVNFDGLNDVAAADSGDGTLSLLLGFGDGGLQTAITYRVGSGPSAVTGGDFNRDGIEDLLVTNSSSNDLSILLGYGNAGFQDSHGNGYAAAGGQVYTPPPSFNFEDLGLAVKVTPHVHGSKSVFLDIDAAVKTLTGQFLNGLPVITNRQVTSQMDLPAGESVLVAGLLSSQEARAIAGIPGLRQFPGIGRLFENRSTSRENTEVLLLIRTRLLSAPAGPFVSLPLRLGSETRPAIPN